jgi:hypothetical protein
MIKTLTTHGDSLALIVGKGVPDLLKIKKETPLEIATDGTNIIISPVCNAARVKAFQSALASALVFLRLNGIDCDDPNGKLPEAMLRMAKGELSKEEFATILREL